MNAYRSLARPLLFALPPERAHGLGVASLRLAGAFSPLVRPFFARRDTGASKLTVEAFGVTFDNPLGLAAGFLKSAHGISGAHALGFGFVEVGTVTPRPQPGNDGPRMFRLPESAAVINRLGFPSAGMEAAAEVLQAAAPFPCPVLVNIGKNKATPNEEAASDYAAAAARLGALGTALVINVSSPNTPGLRDLADERALSTIVAATQQAAGTTPVLVKLSPDAGDDAIDAAVDVCLSHRVAGVIATNTTRRREGVAADAPTDGGLSGPPLRARSTAVIGRVYRRAGLRLPIIGVGGVSDGESALEKILAGASLVQLYTALIFEGPGLPRRILDDVEARLSARGFTHLAQAVGAQSAG